MRRPTSASPLGGHEPGRKSLLGNLVFEQNLVEKENVLARGAEASGVGLIDLAPDEFNDQLKVGIDIDGAWTTWSGPFDREKDVTRMAMAYSLSPAVREDSKDNYNGKVQWYRVTIKDSAKRWENLQKGRAVQPVAAVAAVTAAPAKPSKPAPTFRPEKFRLQASPRSWRRFVWPRTHGSPSRRQPE